LVKEHFKILTQRVRKHNGAVVKTIGDAVMATFMVSHPMTVWTILGARSTLRPGFRVYPAGKILYLPNPFTMNRRCKKLWIVMLGRRATFKPR